MELSEHDLKQLDEETIRGLQAENLRTLFISCFFALAVLKLSKKHEKKSQTPTGKQLGGGIQHGNE